MKFTKEDARKRVLNCAKQYQQNLLHKKLLIIFREKQDNSIRFIEVVFHERNYQHLTGLELTNTEGKIPQHQSKNFYRKCIENKLGLNDVDKVMGGVNFCLGLSRENDVFIPEDCTGTAMHQDKVRVIITKEPQEGKRREGIVVKVLERGMTQIVGTYENSRDFGFVVSDNPKFSGTYLFREKIPRESRTGIR